jgi:tellurite resistance protein
MTDHELATMTQAVVHLPAFADYDLDDMAAVAEACAKLLADDDGVEKVLDTVRDQLPPTFYDTAYALACRVAAVDGELTQEELQLLEMIRHELRIDRLTAAGIERGVAALYRRSEEG